MEWNGNGKGGARNSAGSGGETKHTRFFCALMMRVGGGEMGDRVGGIVSL
jgi:hypothetical protein